jgi:AraC-like DNA-binding protein
VLKPGFKMMGQASPSALAMLLNTLDMMQRAAANPLAGQDERLRRNLQNALLNALHYVITPELARSEHVPRNFIQRTRLFRRAFDHLRVQPPHAYSVMDLCRELHVPEPAMRAVFLEFTGMGPAEFIQRLRMERMRRAWRASAGTDQDLRDAVLDAGFNEVEKARELLSVTVAAVGAFAPDR